MFFVSRHGFAPFAWWRIGVGTLGMVLLLATGPATGESRPASLDAEAVSEHPLSVDDILRSEAPAADHPASGKSERVTAEP